MSLSRRDFIKLTGLAAGTGVANPGLLLPGMGRARAAMASFVPAATGLSDPAVQPKFVNLVPDAMAPGFRFYPKKGRVKVGAGPAVQWTGLTDSLGNPVQTPVFGYGIPSQGFTWPGRTFEVNRDEPLTVKWENKLVDPITGAFLPHLFDIDTNLHWAYSLHGYEHYTIDNAGIPIVMHLHGGHSDFQFDGNPEFFFSPGWGVRGPQWRSKDYMYGNDQQAGTLWYHDHALGITRLNVYAGMAGFYILRDEYDTGMAANPLGLPVWPYEKAYAIQDRMFRATGELFYPAFPGDPFYDDFITGEGAVLPPDLFPGGGPTALAEFFGDHMIVNGMIWPKEDVEPRNYRLRLLNGCDSRFLVTRFRVAAASDATTLEGAGDPLPFTVIGSDQGLAKDAVVTDTLVFEPGGRYDIVFDFKGHAGDRIIMENIGGDAPFGGDFGDALAPEDLFPDRQTDRVMAFDVAGTDVGDSFDPALIDFGPKIDPPITVRQVALFEGTDEFGRLQPLLGANTAAEGEDPIWSAIAWHSPTTETPTVGDVEEWEIYNFTGDAHPVHVHLVHFEILGREAITFDSDDGDPGQQVPQHNGEFGVAPAIENVVVGDPVLLGPADGYVENASKDMVTALPEQVTRIKMKFDKTGRYVWHCHILSHEDHEMMRVLQVMPRPAGMAGPQ